MFDEPVTLQIIRNSTHSAVMKILHLLSFPTCILHSIPSVPSACVSIEFVYFCYCKHQKISFSLLYLCPIFDDRFPRNFIELEVCSGSTSRHAES